MYGFSSEREFLRRTDSHVCDGSTRAASGLTGEVAAVCCERAIVWATVGRGLGHDHVTLGCCSQSSDG